SASLSPSTPGPHRLRQSSDVSRWRFSVYPCPMPTQEQQLEATLRTALKREPPPAEVTTAAQGPLAGRSADRAAFVLKVERIRPDADQVRRMRKGADDPENRELAESIRQFGLQNALDVRWVPQDDIYELVAGERRYLAVT